MKTPLSPRKKPSQKRSVQMMEDILRGAIRVLNQQGGRSFTTIRVAEETGISVGSLYQYFPNKEAILFEVQYREWQETSGKLAGMIADRRYAPAQRLRRAIRAFFQSEWEEAALRKALAETGLNLEGTPQFAELHEVLAGKWTDFLREFFPKSQRRRHRELAEFVFTTVGALGEDVTTQGHSKREIGRWADQCADMILAYLGTQERDKS